MTVPDLLAGRYQMRDILGRGGWAQVYEAWDIRLERAVAIKLLHVGSGADLQVRRRFEAEARAAAALNHPNIVAVHDYGEHNGAPFIVMERLPGNTLADAIAAGPLSPRLLCGVVDDVLAALTAAHDVGIVHRDIKPGNILFSPGGRVKVADFGIAKSAGSDPTATGLVLGTMAYLSPDRVFGRPATATDDLYSVGVIGYEALTGRRPFDHDNYAALARAILDERPAPILALRPDASPDLVAVLERAMARDSAQRFVNARQMRAAWSQASASAASAAQGIGASVPLSQLRPPTKAFTAAVVPMATAAPFTQTVWSPAHRMRTLAWVAAAAVLVLVALVLIVSANAPSPSPRPVTTSTPVAPQAPATSRAPIPAIVEAPREDRKGEEDKKGEREKDGHDKDKEKEKDKKDEDDRGREP